jgi:putative acyl-CoA dehydrogenase
MECLGGSGYVEDSISARLFRESPLNGIWEGAGNVNALDVRRALAKEPLAAAAVEIELKKGSGSNRLYDAAVASVLDQLKSRTFEEWGTRTFVSDLGVLLQASLMIRFASQAESNAFVKSRLELQSRPLIYGAIDRMEKSDVDEIVDGIFQL